MKDKLVDGLRLTKPHLDLGRVHVDVDLGRRQLQKQHVAWLAFQMQHVAVGLAHGMAEDPVADKAAVDESMLGFAAGFRQ